MDPPPAERSIAGDEPRVAPAAARPVSPAPFASLPFALGLFCVWIVLSGKFDGFHLGVGAVTAVLLSRLGQYLIRLPPAVGHTLDRPMQGVSWLRLAAYAPWLAWQIALASVQVARVVLSPKLPIQPRIVRFKSGLPHTLARVTLAQSITLTPGTVTLDLEGDEFVVHALTEAAARDIEGGRIQRRVTPLFEAGAPKERAK